MDYKITTLTNEVVCENVDIPGFPSMKFGNLSNGLSVFDSTNYYAENELEPINYKTFGRVCRHYINTLVTKLELNLGELFFQNTDGHILINKELAVTFLQFANPDIYVYFNSMTWDLLENGFAISDSFVVALAAARVPDEVLKEIIETRNGANETS